MKSRIKIISYSIITIILLGITTNVAGSINYQPTIAKGTEEFVVNQYDDGAWNSIVDSSTNPSNWFQGETNNTNAKSKITVKGWISTSWQLYDALTTVFMPLFLTTAEIYALLGIMASQKFNETTINANYTSTYRLWYGLRSVWNFTIAPFEEDPSYTDGIFILQNPLDYVDMLDEYNALTEVLNGNMAIQLSGYSFQNYTADEFLWQIAMNGFAIASPQSDYLTEMVEALGCLNASAIDSTLKFERYGATDYIVEISYGSRGTISTFTVKDMSESIIFKFTGSNTDWIFYTILTTSGVFALIIIVYIIYKGRKLKKR